MQRRVVSALRSISARSHPRHLAHPCAHRTDSEPPAFHQPLLRGPPCLSGALLTPREAHHPSMQPLPLANLRTAGEDPSAVLGLPTPCLSQTPWCTLLGPCPLPLPPSSPGPSLSSGMPFSASHPNQGKHDKNLPWSSPPVLLAHCTPMCQMWVTPRLHPPPLGFLFHLIWFSGCVLHRLMSVSFPGALLLCLTPGPQ